MSKLTKYFLLSPFVFAFLACSSTPEKKEAPVAPVASAFNLLTMSFEKLDGCFLLYDMKSKDYIEEFNSARCRQQTAPCSTFKVPLAVMAFDAGVLKDEQTKFKWDGKKRSILTWNQDQTASSWMKESVVWYSQIITKKMGRKKVQAYLDKFQYGNHDFSGDIATAWLTGSPALHDRTKTLFLI